MIEAVSNACPARGKQMSRQFMMVLILAVAVGGCGRRGPVEPPSLASGIGKHVDDKSIAGSSDVALTPSKAHKPPPVQPGNGSFILDPLL